MSLDIDLNPQERKNTFIIIGICIALLIVGSVCIWWGFFGAESTQDPPAGETATSTQDTPVPPTPTQEDALVPLATGSPSSTGEQPSPPPATPTLEEEEFGYGVAVDALPLPDYTMSQVDSLGLRWVKQQVRWDDFEPNPGQMDWSGYDAVIEAAHSRGLRVMLSVVGAPTWTREYTDDTPEAAPPDDLSMFADFLARLVDRYQGRIHAIEVWNEQNLDREWDTAEGVDPQRYVEMLSMAYQVIKSRDPDIIVISGALSPVGGTQADEDNPSRIIWMDDYQYLQEMVSHGFLSYADCVGIHHNGYNIPPDVAWDEDYVDDTAVFRGFWDSPHPSWSFQSTMWRYHEAVDGMRPLCVTEFGWASSEGLSGYPTGFEFAQDNTLQEQALYTIEAFQLMREWGFVRLAFLWNLNYANTGPRTAEDPNAPYSLVDYDGVARPAFQAVMEMEKP